MQAAIQDARVSLVRHATRVAERIDAREAGARRWSGAAQRSDRRLLAVIADAFGIDVDPLFVDSFTAWRIVQDLKLRAYGGLR